jgi:hypothetical protein
VLAFSRSSHIDEFGHLICTEDVERLDTRGLAPHERVALLAQRLRHSIILGGLIRREVVSQTQLLAPYSSSDYVLCTQLALLGEFIEVPDFLYSKRIHSGNSRRANVTQQDVARWFNTAERGRVYFPYFRMLREQARVINRSHLSALEKLRSLSMIPRCWVPRFWRILAKELIAPFVPAFGRYDASWRRVLLQRSVRRQGRREDSPLPD